jgi:hypothetical protein
MAIKSDRANIIVTWNMETLKTGAVDAPVFWPYQSDINSIKRYRFLTHI